MSRISSAFRSFFAILFGKGLPEDVARAFGYVKPSEVKPAAAPAPEIRISDGALQILGILQRGSGGRPGALAVALHDEGSVVRLPARRLPNLPA